MDLLSSRPFWPWRDGVPASFPPLVVSTTCDVAIIGAGVTGALVALALAEAGREVVVLDRREAAHGSTAGNTGLLLYELDVMLHRLARLLGPGVAQRVYRRAAAAIDHLEETIRTHQLECGFVRRPSLYLAARADHVSRLRREFTARRAAGLDVTWWGRRTLAAESSLPHRAGILSGGSAQLDVYRLTYGLLRAAQRVGARVHDHTDVRRWDARSAGVELRTARGPRVRARDVVVAAGYEAEPLLPQPVATLQSTFALVTEPIGPGGWAGWPDNQCLLWDTADPYLYLRRTDDGRALIGGYDEPWRDPASRDRLLPAKAATLQRRFRRLFPAIPCEVASAWAGTFGTTPDGLPVIGPHPVLPHVWFALGYGGNGTTFSVIAAELIRAGLLGPPDPEAEWFGLNRPTLG
jgi:glycine/D-amino acid oxidase-like deaminating enzyme